MAEVKTEVKEKKTASKLESIDCPICLVRVNKPKYLPCLHTFCETCLQTYISSVTQIESPVTFDCPVCRRAIEPLEEGIQISEWAKLFPTNHLVESLSDSEEGRVIKYCVICERHGKQILANNTCFDCAESICDPCRLYHDVFGQFRNHKVMNFEEIKSTDNIITLLDVEQECQLHKRKYVEVYCFDHEKLCCSVCFATKHRHCKNVEEIGKVREKMKNEFLEYDLTVLADISLKLDEFIVQKEEKLSHLNTQKDQIMDGLATKVKEIKSLIDNLHSQFAKAFELDHENNISNIERCITDLKGLRTSIQSATKLLRVVLHRGSKKQIFMSTANHVQQLLDQFDRFSAANKEDTEKSYQWEFDSLLKQISDSGKVKEIIVNTHKTSIVNDLAKRLPALCILRFELPSIVPWMRQPTIKSLELTAHKKKEFKLETRAYNAIFFDEKTILFSMKSCLTLLEIHDQTKSSVLHRFDGAPRFLQNGQYGDEFMMTVGTKVTKYMVNRETNTIFNLEKEIDIKETAEGFCFCKDFLVSATRSSITILKYDPEVSIFKAIEETREGDIGYVAASWTGEKFAYVTGSKIVCCSADGTEIFRYNNDKLKSPGGLAFDSLDNIYVCTTYFETNIESQYDYNWDEYRYVEEKTGGGVIQVLNDGSAGRVFLSGYKNARFIHFCSNGELFLVSDGEKCTIYNLSKG